MNQLFLFVIILIITLFIALKCWRLALSVSVFNFLIFLLIALGFIPNLLLNGLQVNPHLDKPEWGGKNAIILLGAGAVKWPSSEFISSQNSAYSRIYEAARLYYNCKMQSKFCHIMPTGGDPGGHGVSEAAIMQKELIAIGINSSDIITEVASDNTFENAQFSSQLILKENHDYLVLVTSGTHMKRALKAFAEFGVTAVPAPADHLSIKTSWKYLYQNFYVTDLALHEYVGSLKNYLKNIFLFSK